MPVNGNLLDLLCRDWERGLSIPGCSFLTHPLDQQGQFLQFPVGTEAHGLCACWAPGPPGCSCLVGHSTLPNSPGQGWSHLETQPLV